MKQENMPKRRNLFLSIAAIALFSIGAGMTFLGGGNTASQLLSQFSGANTSPSTAVTQWTPTPSNSYRNAVGLTNASRLDTVVRSILSHGNTLNVTQFKTFLANVEKGIKNLATTSDYAEDKNVQNIVGYISFELSDAQANVTSGKDFVTDMVGIIDVLKKESTNTLSETGVTNNTAPAAPSLSVNKTTFTKEEADRREILFTWSSNGGTDCYVDRYMSTDYVSIPSVPKPDLRATFSFPSVNTFNPMPSSSAWKFSYSVFCTQKDGSKKYSEKVTVKVTGFVGTEFTKVDTPGYVCSEQGLVRGAFGNSCLDEGSFTYTKKDIYYDGRD